jgi:thiamine biosynthesis protein ThiI
VSLESADVTVFVELAGGRAFVTFERIRGLGGLPVGVSGRVLCLLSGGIDSAVAAWLMLKRGCTVELLHVHPYRSAEEVATTKIAAIAQQLASYARTIRLHMVPFFLFEQKAISVDSRFGALLFRRFLLQLGDALARRIGASAVVTGDSLAQVASQTLPNLAATDHGVDTLILRPLLTYDKEDIVDLSRRIGTYPLSLHPYKDCCSLLARHPETHASAYDIEVLEELIDLPALVDATLAEAHQLEASAEGSAPSPRPPLAGPVPAA